MEMSVLLCTNTGVFLYHDILGDGFIHQYEQLLIKKVECGTVDFLSCFERDPLCLGSHSLQYKPVYLFKFAILKNTL